MTKRFLTRMAGEEHAIRTYSQGSCNIWLPAAAFYPETTAGCQALEVEELTTGQPSRIGMRFDPDASEHAQTAIVMPASWDGRDFYSVVYWTATGGTGDVLWRTDLGTLVDSDPLQTALADSRTRTDSFITANDIHIMVETSNILPGAAENGYTGVLVRRVATNVGDTLTTDAIFIGVKLRFNIDEAQDY